MTSQIIEYLEQGLVPVLSVAIDQFGLKSTFCVFLNTLFNASSRIPYKTLLLSAQLLGTSLFANKYRNTPSINILLSNQLPDTNIATKEKETLSFAD